MGVLAGFLVVADVVVDFGGELEVPVEIAAVWVVGVGQDRELLLALVLEDFVAAGWTVVLAFDLAEEEDGFFFGVVFVLHHPGEHFFVREEVTGDHGEDEPAVVTDVLAFVEGVEEVGHHGVFAEFGFAVRGGLGFGIARGVTGIDDGRGGGGAGVAGAGGGWVLEGGVGGIGLGGVRGGIGCGSLGYGRFGFGGVAGRVLEFGELGFGSLGAVCGLANCFSLIVEEGGFVEFYGSF